MLDPRFDYNRPPSVNFFNRRYFCFLFVTFDLVFVTLLWLICIVINGENIYKALENQIVNYTIKSSLFDVVAAAAARFIILILFYAILETNHWIIIALTTSVSCGFLITKVFFYEWPLSQQPFQVLLIIISFVISWFEAWFLGSRVISEEEYSRTLSQALHSASGNETSPLLAPFLSRVYGGNFLGPESHRQSFYSLVESVDNSDDEISVKNFLQKLFVQRPHVDEKFINIEKLSMDEELKQLGTETVKKAYELLESTAWKQEKVTACNDIIYTTVQPIGKVYKLRAKINYPAKKLLYELFYKIEDVPAWNPTLIESKIIKRIDSNTDIAYSVSTSGGGGIVSSRDFVNLRCWKLVNKSNVIEDYDINSTLPVLQVANRSSCDGDNENSSDDEDKNEKTRSEKNFTKSASYVEIYGNSQNKTAADHQLSKSLDATNINCVSEDDDEPFTDAQAEVQSELDDSKNVFVSAAISIDYTNCPPTNKYIRGNNIISCWAMRPNGKEDDSCIFEWVLCIDLKGSLPKYILNTAFVSLMTDYIFHLRKRVQQLNDKDEWHKDQQTC